MVLKEVFCQSTNCSHIDAVGMCSVGAIVISEDGRCLKYDKVITDDECECDYCNINTEKQNEI